MNNSIKILIIICSLALFTNCDNSSNTTQNEKLLIVTFEDSLSYSLGVNIGKNLPDAQFNQDLIKEGLDDYWNKKEPRLNNADRQTILREFNVRNSEIERDQMQLASEDARELSRKNKIIGQEFLEKNKTKEGVRVRQRSGLQYKIIKEGFGKVPDYDDEITIHYNGYLIDGHKFDSSYDKGQPITLRVDRFIAGWQEALLMMPVGSQWEIYVSYNLAYGEAGIQGSKLGEYVVPPSATLIFEMELLDIIQ
ncbi:MAG: FKBP-type peptidyl-prolyl cis-trans isomerase [bacterium]|jgi:FKBP-type peptidyl-prolyl cis-trans isomerase|nr:FKBP-type peptidyl-prolyl cis-trans isomerase [Candidatus Neomarinimicrobiota bacterium]HIL86092.1 FKBP-type peptidyl-prolyl cis-trans isomerase [Candidatus Neomarinimicrobiota bacterium]